MARLPAYILRDCTIVANDRNRIGQATEITIPVLEKTTEEMRNAGMIKPREVFMGYEATRASFKETAFDPAMIELLGVGKNDKFIARGYLQSEDGTEHAARFEFFGDVLKMDAGSWQTGSRAETEYEITVHSGTLFVETNGAEQEILAFDDFSVRVMGTEQMPGRRRALGMI